MGESISIPEDHEQQARSTAATRNVRFADQDEEARSPGGGIEGLRPPNATDVVDSWAEVVSGRGSARDQAGVEFTGYNEQEPAEDREVADNEEMEEDPENSGQRVLSQCVLSFKVDNQTGSSKVIELRIKPLGACNFSVPVSAIPCEVCSHS